MRSPIRNRFPMVKEFGRSIVWRKRKVTLQSLLAAEGDARGWEKSSNSPVCVC